MNRFKKEEKRRKEEARRGLSKEEIVELDEKEELQEKIIEEARKLHVELFPEEYDHMYDSIADAQDRARGTNPMNKAYTEKMNRKREFMGVGPLDSTGMPASADSWNQCLEFVKKKMGKI
jgi:hypothetical protein